MNASYEYAVAPKFDLDAFPFWLKVTGWEDLNLLPGEANIFFEGTFGKDFYRPQQYSRYTFSIHGGRDKRIVVKREKVKNLNSRKVIGTNEKARERLGDYRAQHKIRSREVVVEDQIPVSQNSQIEVTVIDLGVGKQDVISGKPP